MIVAFRRHSLLPLDDCLYALQPTIPHLTRSSLHRCLQRHGISRLPDMEGDKPARRTFKAYPIGFFHIDIAEVRTAEGKLHPFVAIDRTSKFAFVQLVERATRATASAFLVALIEAVSYRIHTVPTDRAIAAPSVRARWRGASSPAFRRHTPMGPTASFITHMSDMRCREHGIEHRLTKPNHPWTNGQVERMNRTIKKDEAGKPIHWIGPPNGKRYHYDDHDQLRRHLSLLIDAYNHARRLKTLRGLTPAQFIWKQWQENPSLFHQEPCHLTAGPCS